MQNSPYLREHGHAVPIGQNILSSLRPQFLLILCVSHARRSLLLTRTSPDCCCLCWFQAKHHSPLQGSLPALGPGLTGTKAQCKGEEQQGKQNESLCLQGRVGRVWSCSTCRAARPESVLVTSERSALVKYSLGWV